MKKKLKYLIVIFALTTGFAKAQKNIGIDYYEIGEYALAKKYFEQEIAQSPAQANYYLGEIAFAQGKLESAKSYYTKGQTADNKYVYNEIGLAKLESKANPKAGETTLNTILRTHNSDLDIKLAIGYAYLDLGLKSKAAEIAEECLAVDKKYPKAYILQGDIHKFSQELGIAAGKYEMAIYFTPNYPISYLKIAELYEHNNWKGAIEKLKDLTNIDPDYIIAYRYLGKIYTNNGLYPQAIEAYKTFFAAKNYSIEDISRYASALYFSKQYDEADKMIKEGLTLDSSNFVLNRLQIYIAANTQNHADGLQYAQKFFSLKSNNSDYLAKDFAMYATILKDAKKYDEALEQYKKALTIDSTEIELYKEMATVASLKKENGKAAEFYKLYIEKTGEKAEAMDFFQLGRYYYSAANIRTTADTTAILALHTNEHFLNIISNNHAEKDSLQKDKGMFVKKVVEFYSQKADSAFDVIIARIPDGYTGYLWKARTKSLLDPDSEMGLAKPFYEKTVEMLEAKKENTKAINAVLVESYSYLGYFYYLKNDTENTRLYWNKVLELDPENANAKMVLKSLK